MTVTTDSPIADLNLPPSLVKALNRGGYKNIRDLTTRTAAFFDHRGYDAKEIRLVTETLAKHGLEFAKPIGDWNRCGTCPTCQTCGNPRAVNARNVVLDLDGRAGHHGGRTGAPVCDGCDSHHRALVATRATELAGAR